MEWKVGRLAGCAPHLTDALSVTGGVPTRRAEVKRRRKRSTGGNGRSRGGRDGQLFLVTDETRIIISAVRRGIFVERHPQNEKAPSGAAYSGNHLAADGKGIVCGRCRSRRRWEMR